MWCQAEVFNVMKSIFSDSLPVTYEFLLAEKIAFSHFLRDTFVKACFSLQVIL